MTKEQAIEILNVHRVKSGGLSDCAGFLDALAAAGAFTDGADEAERLGAQRVLQSLQNFDATEHDAVSVLRECAGALDSKGFKSYPVGLRFIADRLAEQWRMVGEAVTAEPSPPVANGASEPTNEELDRIRNDALDACDRTGERPADTRAVSRAMWRAGRASVSRQVGPVGVTPERMKQLRKLAALHHLKWVPAAALDMTELTALLDAAESGSRTVAVGSKARAISLLGRSENYLYDMAERAGALHAIAVLDHAGFFADEATLAEIDEVAQYILNAAASPDGETPLWLDTALGRRAVHLATAVRKLGIGGGR